MVHVCQPSPAAAGRFLVSARKNGRTTKYAAESNEAKALHVPQFGLERLNDYAYKQSIRVIKEADKLIERVLFLEGLPNAQGLGKVQVGAEVVERLADDLRFEREVQRSLPVDSIALCEQLRD